MSNELQIVPLRNNLLLDYKRTEIKNKITARIHELGLVQIRYKSDSELLNLICSLVEYLVDTKRDKICKKTLVIEIIDALFQITDDEKNALSYNIEFLHSNCLIKKPSYYKLFKTGIKEWIFKKKG